MEETGDKNITEYLNATREEYKHLPDAEKTILLSELLPDEMKENYYDAKTHETYKKSTQERIKKYSEYFDLTKEEVEKNYTKFAYYYALETLNEKYSSKSEFEKQQEDLKRQIDVNTDPERRAELEKGLYIKVPDLEAVWHNIGIDKNGNLYIDTSFPNEKYVNLNGQEVVFNKATGKWVSDGINDATYNIAVWEKDWNILDLLHHGSLPENDVNMWKEYGVGSNDKLTKDQRNLIYNKGIYIYENEKLKEMKKYDNEYIPYGNFNKNNTLNFFIQDK